MSLLILLQILSKYYPAAFRVFREIAERVLLMIGVGIFLLCMFVGIRELPLHLQNIAGRVVYVVFVLSMFWQVVDIFLNRCKAMKDFLTSSDEPR